MKRYRITDEDNEEYLVEEQDEDTSTKEVNQSKDEDTVLTPEEIASLKQLAAKATEILKLLDVEASEHANDEDETGLDEENLADENIEEKRNEQVVDTENCKDSKHSFGANQKRKAYDSTIDKDIEIADAWKKRYGGK